jgi:hypothetical protein
MQYIIGIFDYHQGIRTLAISRSLILKDLAKADLLCKQIIHPTHEIKSLSHIYSSHVSFKLPHVSLGNRLELFTFSPFT